MDRRRFLQNLALTAGAATALPSVIEASQTTRLTPRVSSRSRNSACRGTRGWHSVST